MGWLFYTDRRVQTYADEKAEIARLCTFESDTRKTELVKACKVGSTWYAAAKITSIDGSPVEDATYVTDADGSITFGAVFLTRYDDGCWGYKDMEESAGPVESRAPLSLLALLSDLKDLTAMPMPGASAAGTGLQSRTTRKATRSSSQPL